MGWVNASQKSLRVYAVGGEGVDEGSRERPDLNHLRKEVNQEDHGF